MSRLAVHPESTFNRWVQVGSTNLRRRDFDKPAENLRLRRRLGSLRLREV